MGEVPGASAGNSLIATHLARWLEVEDGSESFFELELARGSICPFAQIVDEDNAYSEQQPLDLVVWKGIIHDALLGIIYRRGSFFMTLKPIAESSDVVSDGVLDDDASTQLFAGVPPHLNKGRGYLVPKPHALRPAEHADEKLDSCTNARPKADKVARPHHVSRLSSNEALLSLQAKALTSPQPVPWDLRTGRPL
ncbi:hypothetical protein PHMEG_00024168 [Phytophthora megakarya]|uniref:Uncharacterized protein n=1 Tax=Phytophthora megakarya TaxID=4795 RepID=A0A225VGU7_9STRA|nr:hypothetical protein PHMEG_00024168 [Phytophthora megakarya]